MSLNLFPCLLEDIFRELEWKEHCIIVNGTRLSNLRFANNIVPIAKSVNELKKMGEELFKETTKKRLQENIIKTKYMSSNPKTPLTMAEKNIEKMERNISLSRGMEKEIEVRKDKAW